MALVAFTPQQQQELNKAIQTVFRTTGLNYSLALTPNSRPYSIVQRGASGYGFIATRYIPEGSRILEEQLLFSVDNIRDPLTRGNILDIQGQAATHQNFNSLFCPPGDQQSVDQRRFQTNSFQITKEDADGRSTEGIFMDASRINHSCVANAHFAWNKNLNRLTIHAITEIWQGHEIFVNYRRESFYHNTQNRRNELRNDYGFECMCKACTTNTHFGRLSQIRRPDIAALKNNIDNRPSRQAADRDQQFRDILALRGLLNAEELFYPGLADAWGQEAACYDAEARKKPHLAIYLATTARREAWKALQEKLVLDVKCTGPDSKEVMETLDLISNLH